MDPLTSTANAAGTSVDLAVSFAEDAKNTDNTVKNMRREGAAKRRAMDTNFLNASMVKSQNQMQVHGKAQAEILTGQR